MRVARWQQQDSDVDDHGSNINNNKLEVTEARRCVGEEGEAGRRESVFWDSQTGISKPARNPCREETQPPLSLASN